MPSPTCSTDSHKPSRTYVCPAHRIATDHNVAVIIEASRRCEILSPSSQAFTNVLTLVQASVWCCGGGSDDRRLRLHSQVNTAALRCLAVVVQASITALDQIRFYLAIKSRGVSNVSTFGTNMSV